MKTRFTFALTLLTTALFAQLNSTLRSQVDYVEPVNDVWGYVAPDGTEYAIVGIEDGVSFVSLADPDNAQEVVFVPGDRSIWRDMKTFGDYAYTVADQGDEGISAFDLRFLPDSVPVRRNQYQIPGFAPTFIQAHNLYIDEPSGRLFTAGGSGRINGGGVLIFDLKVDDPLTPVYLGRAPSTYAHDVYVKGDTVYASEINEGELEIYDISDLDNVVSLGASLTPFTFTHNAWTTDDAQTIFTTDEKGNAPVAAYDISDPSDIRELFQFRPRATVDRGVIPHNVHVIDDYLSISYYTDGLVVADASKPDNIIEVANYDTWTGGDGGFNGAWGAFPYLPSGLTLVSDRSTGLYVVDVDYKRAARLEGTITDADFGDALNDVTVEINAPQINAVRTDVNGEFKTGLANGGTFSVTISAPNYDSLTLDVTMNNGDCIRLDTTLTALVRRFDVNLTVVDSVTGELIPGATVVLTSDDEDLSAIADDDGQITFSRVFEGDYNLYVTEWGYRTAVRLNVSPADFTDGRIELVPGYMDDFITDEGWVASGDAVAGRWERDEPVGTFFGNAASAPGDDVAGDIGEQAYVTGNGGGGAGDDDVDGGTVTLTSPEFGPLRLRPASLAVAYQYWWFNDGGDGNPNDELTISITDGTQTAVARTYTIADGESRWIADTFVVSDFVDVTRQLQLIVETDDQSGSGHLVEAGFDNFVVIGEEIPSSTDNRFDPAIEARIFPNPSSTDFALDFSGVVVTQPRLRIVDALGQVIREIPFAGNRVNFGADLARGFYVAELFDGARRLYSTKLIKQ